MLELFTVSVLIFFIINLINVALSTIRSLTTIKSSKLVASITNALSYGFYAAIIKLITGFPISTVVIVTIIANLIGVYFSIWLYDKFKKDRMWKITVLANEKDSFTITHRLKHLEEKEEVTLVHHIQSVYANDLTNEFTIFAKSQKESAKVRWLIDGLDVRYYIVELSKTL